MADDKNPPAEINDNSQNEVVTPANPETPPIKETSAQIEDSVEVDDFDFSVIEATLDKAEQTKPVSPVTSPVAPKKVEAETGSVPAPASVPIAPTPQPVQPVAATTATTPEVKPASSETKAPNETPAVAVESTDGFTALDQAIQASREKVIDAVATGTYVLTQEELDAVQVEPEKILPKLMARVHVNAVQGVVRHIAQQMPAMVGALMQAKEQTSRLESEFFKAWPQLDKTKHGADIMKVGQVFRQLNPNATFEEFVRHVGAQVIISNGLHVQAQQPKVQQPNVPAAGVTTTPAFQPAGIGRTSTPAAPSVPKNVWEEMVEVMSE